MLRDSRRDKAYFDEWIDYIQKTITEEQQEVYPLLEGQAIQVYSLFSDSMQQCIMMYSRGDSLPSMKDCVWHTLEMREQMMQKLSELAKVNPEYVEMYTELELLNYTNSFILLCFVHAVGGTQEDILRTLRAFDYTGQDILLDKIAVLLGDDSRTKKMAAKLEFPSIYQRLLDVVDASAEKRPALMKKFVERWYKSMKPAAWHDNDKGGEGAYYGYWCFEAALVVRMLDIDDSSFRDNIYYPRDMVARDVVT